MLSYHESKQEIFRKSALGSHLPLRASNLTSSGQVIYHQTIFLCQIPVPDSLPGPRTDARKTDLMTTVHVHCIGSFLSKKSFLAKN
jgi:hypothetical protein